MWAGLARSLREPRMRPIWTLSLILAIAFTLAAAVPWRGQASLIAEDGDQATETREALEELEELEELKELTDTREELEVEVEDDCIQTYKSFNPNLDVFKDEKEVEISVDRCKEKRELEKIEKRKGKHT